MPSSVPTYYWDACVLLALVNGEAARLPDLEALLDAASKSEITILTSTVSKVEVAFGAAEQQRGALDAGVEAKISQLWDTGSPVKLVDFHEILADDARGLIRKAMVGTWSLKGLDAIHLATAIRHKADAFHTYDGQLLSIAKHFGVIAEEPSAPQPMMPLQNP